MLFSSNVFMSRTILGKWISVVLFFILKFGVALNSQFQNDNSSSFDNDFGNFLRDLGSKVYRVKKVDVTQNEIRSSQDYTYSAPTIKNFRRNQNTLNTQKAILQDVLMMKLVSYYEDKYKLSHLEPTTTESITIANGFTNDALTKHNSFQYNDMEKEEVPSSKSMSKTTKRVVTSLNRRMQRDMRQIDDEYQVPEVVIF